LGQLLLDEIGANIRRESRIEPRRGPGQRRNTSMQPRENRCLRAGGISEQRTCCDERRRGHREKTGFESESITTKESSLPKRGVWILFSLPRCAKAIASRLVSRRSTYRFAVVRL
jgi:hypothetical protein